MHRVFLFTLPILILLSQVSGTHAEPFEFRDGDRVVLLGDTLIEREQYHGWIEMALTTRFPDRHVTFRNLGWSADTPAGESRCGLSLLQAGLEPPEEGWRMLKEQLKQTKPTVVILGYGMASSFAGEEGLPKFRADMERLLDTIQEQAGATKVRVVILSPITHLPGPAPLPKPDVHNEQLGGYSAALKDLAAQRGAVFVSLFDGLRRNEEKVSLSENGIHLNAAGYRAAAQVIEQGLGWPPSAARDDAIERLRNVILKKNELFFHRSRPANMAYIFGFRKAEQGRNAVEIPQFDALIEAEEKKIALLRSLKPVKLPEEPAPRTQAAAAKFTPQPRPSFEVAPELEVTLWAENPQLHKPIQMNFDPQGRLWVASSEVYPQIEPGQTANDKIIILEDTDGDGKADKSTVFADGLLIPTGLEPGDGGVYVAQSTELLHFKDTDGDGKADARRIVLSGFGTEDTHHNLHTLRWGHDGRLYMNQSIYTRTDTETPDGVVRLKGGGVVRLNPKSLAMDIFVRGFWNSWGHQFDAFGQSFLTDGAGDSGINYGLPGATYVGAPRPRRLLDGISPGKYPKFCSLEIIYSQHFPPDWQGDMIACDFRANRIVRFRVNEEGAGYVAQEIGSILRSKEVSFRPIDVKLGPDGALYIADWSNPIINHGEVDFRDPRRDREHGRIWRVSVKGRPLNPRPQLVGARIDKLFNVLKSLNSYDRAQARRVILERGRSVLADLRAWPENEYELLETVWLTQALGDLHSFGRDAKDGRVRAARVRALGEWFQDESSPLTAGLRERITKQLAESLKDPHARVRLEAVRTLARVQTADAATQALTVLDLPMDRFLDYALWLTMNELADPWLAALADGSIKTEGADKGLLFGLSAVPPEKASQAIARLLEKQPLTRDGRGPWIELIGQGGGPSELRKLFDQATQGGFDDAAGSRALAALGEAARLRRARPPGDLQSLSKLLEAKSVDVRVAAIRLAGRWRLEDWTPRLAALATDRATPLPLRGVACDALRELKGPAAVTALRTVATNDQESPTLQRQALVALVSIDPEGALPLARETMNEGAGPDADELWRSLLGLTGMGKRLADQIREKPLARSAATVGLRVARDSAESNLELVKLLAQQAGVPEPKIWSAGELQQLAAQARSKGDATRGELVYRRADLKCITCHALGGAGGKVGPDLTSIGAGAPLDYLVESILAPNRKIKEGYHAIVLLTSDGRTLSGIPVRESDKEVILRDAEDKEIAVPLADIDRRANSSSLMPVSLVDGVAEQDRLDLFRFLGELGRPGAFDATRGQSPRLWRVLTTRLIINGDKTQIKQAETGDVALRGWANLTTTVGGALLRSEVDAVFGSNRPPERAYVATRFELPRAGKATFTFNSKEPVQLWLDGHQHVSNGKLEVDLSAGRHTLVVHLDLTGQVDQFVVKSSEVVFLPTP